MLGWATLQSRVQIDSLLPNVMDAVEILLVAIWLWMEIQTQKALVKRTVLMGLLVQYMLKVFGQRDFIG